MDLNGGRRPNVFISNPKNPTMSDFTKCLNSCVNDWQGPASYDKWNALYMDPSGGVSSPNSKAFSPNLKGYNTFLISFIISSVCASMRMSIFLKTWLNPALIKRTKLLFLLELTWVLIMSNHRPICTMTIDTKTRSKYMCQKNDLVIKPESCSFKITVINTNVWRPL